MALPGIKKDANGLPVMVGVQERITTQQQADYTDLARSLEGVTGIDGYNARKMFAENPGASAGLIAGLAKAGAAANNPLVKTLADIDAQTQAQRKLDAQKESQRISTEKFNNSLWGNVWAGLVKGPIRNLALTGQTMLDVFNMVARHTTMSAPAIIGGPVTALSKFASNITNPEENKVTPIGLKSLDELTIYQMGKQFVKEGKVDLGSGFSISEETGAGFAARQAAMSVKKVSFKVGDKTYYRPYSAIDPIANVLTAGHPESAAARVIVALGEIGLSFKTDPILIYSKLAAAKKIAQIDAETKTGMAAAKAAEKYSILKSQEEALKKSMNDSFEAMLRTPDNKDIPIKEVTNYSQRYEQLTKVKDEYGNIQLDLPSIEQFLSGTQGAHIIDGIAQIDNWRDIQKLAKGKFTVDEAVALAAAKTRDEVLLALAPFVANGTITSRALEEGTVTGRAIRNAQKTLKETKGIETLTSKLPTVLKIGSGVGAAAKVTGAAARAITRAKETKLITEISNRYHAFLPEQGGSLIHITNKDKLIETINNVGTYVGLNRATINRLMDEVALSTNPQQAGMNASGRLFDAIFEQYGKDLAPELKTEFERITRVFETERRNISTFWAQQHATGTDINFAIAGGKNITLHSSHLDSELLNSFVFIPDAREVKDFLTTAKKFGATRVAASDWASQLNNMWKKSVMVRPAYIARNIIEEQIRVYGTGHMSFFNNPLAAMAMWLGRDGGPQWKALLNKIDETKNDVFGESFKMSTSAEEFAAEQLAGELINPYVAFMSDAMSGASHEADLNKILRSRGYIQEVFGRPKWWEGFGNQIRILHNSEFVRKVLTTKSGNELATVKYFLEGEGRKTLDTFASLKTEEVAAWLKTEEGLMQYLFTGLNDKGQAASVLARIEELAGGGDGADFIKKLLLKGTVTIGQKTITIPNGRMHAEQVLKASTAVGKKAKKSSKAIRADLHRDFSKSLEDTFLGLGNWDGVHMTIPMEITQKGGSFRNMEARLNDAANKFFDKAVEFEKTSTMGPEWRQSYWDAIRSIAGSLDSSAIAKLKGNAYKSLSPLRNPMTGERIGAKHGAWDALDKAAGDGVITLDEAHRYATNVANRKVAGLFYNATKRNLLFHQLRLIGPFIQAWEDTLKSWGKIALDNPMQIYKVSKLTDWSTKSQSSALYEFTDAKDYYDPNQGFFFNDPSTGERKFFVPFATTALNFLQTAMIGGEGVRKSGPMAFSAQPQSFNFALGGGSIFPGFGPGVVWGLSALSAINKNPLKILPAQLEEELYRIAFPYGTPDIKNKGIFEGPLLSSNWTRVLGAAAGVESSYAAAFAPSMGYLAASGDYNLDDPQDQIRLVRDGDNMARWFTFWRGLFGAATPIPFSMRPEALAKNKNGDTVLATALWADFKNLEVAAGGDKQKAYGDFIDTYGPEQIFAIVRTTTGYEPTNLPTYVMLREHPEVLDLYPDTYGYFYPNGELSKVLYQFQKERGTYAKMSTKDIMAKVTNIRYSAALDRLRTRSVGENWTSDQFQAMKDQLAEKYNQRGRVAPAVDTQWFDTAISQLKAASNDDNLQGSEAMYGIRAYLVQRDKALGVLKQVGLKTLSSDAALPQRTWLANEALQLVKKYPDFQKVFYGVFKQELEGK